MKSLPLEDLDHVYKHTKNLWESVRAKSIFITGGTGFFGKWLLESFLHINQRLDLKASITVLTRNPERVLSDYPFYSGYKNLNFVKGNVIDFEYPEKKFHYIIHAATDADSQLNTENPLLMSDTIILGTRRVLDFARLQPLKSFLLTSSGAVYGRQPADTSHISETDSFPIEMNILTSAYAEGKRMAEFYCSAYHKKFNLPVKIARCFAFVGPYLPLDKHFAIGNFILNAIKNEDIVIKGDGTPYRSYLYSSDLAVWIWTILFKGTDNSQYNVGSDESISIKELAELVAKLSPGIDVKILSKDVLDKSRDVYIPSIKKARQLGLSVSVSLEEAIQKTKKYQISS